MHFDQINLKNIMFHGFQNQVMKILFRKITVIDELVEDFHSKNIHEKLN